MFTDEVLPDLSPGELGTIAQRFPHSRALLDVDSTIKGYYQGLRIDESRFRIDRAQVFLRVAGRYIDDLLPPGLSAGAVGQLASSPIASTAEHMASNTNPQTLNVVINQALYRRYRNEEYVLALACTALRLDNILLSGDLFIGDHKVHLLSRKYDRTLVAEAPPVDCEYVAQNIAATAARGDGVVRARAAELLDWWDAAYRKIAHLDSYWKQLTVLNHAYWKELVGSNHLDLPDEYICLPVCVLVRDAMIADLEAGRGGWIYDLLFDPRRRDAAYRTFDGVRSCWESRTQSGTFLFWTMNRKGEPKPMAYQDGVLKSEGVAGELALTPESVLAALRSGKVYPASFLFISYLGFYLGLQLFGGILQVQYYPEMRQRILTGNPLGLADEDLALIRSLRADLYLNFEKRELSDGGLLKLYCPQPPDVFHKYLERSFRQEIMGCVGYLMELTK
jgi:hypothetical protein